MAQRSERWPDHSLSGRQDRRDKGTAEPAGPLLCPASLSVFLPSSFFSLTFLLKSPHAWLPYKCKTIRNLWFLFGPNTGMGHLPSSQVPARRKLLPRASGIDPETQRCYTGEVLRARFDYLAQVRRDLWQYTEFSPKGELMQQASREMALRWTYRWELYHLLSLSGFTAQAEYSDFASSPPVYGAELIVIARTGP